MIKICHNIKIETPKYMLNIANETRETMWVSKQKCKYTEDTNVY